MTQLGPPRIIPRGALAGTTADHVAMTATAGGLWLAWSSATLGAETVRAAGLTGDLWHGEHAAPFESSAAFRPALASLAGGVLGVALVRRGGRFGLGAWRVDQPGAGWEIPTRGSVHRVSLASRFDDDLAWLAWEERAGRDVRIRLARASLTGRVEVQGLPWDEHGRSPALAIDGHSVWCAWLTPARGAAAHVVLGRLDDRAGDRVRVDGHPGHQEAPAVAPAGDGCWVAWHSGARGHVDDDVLRWLRVAFVDGAGSVSEAHPPRHEDASQAEAGTDQGWELAALAPDADGNLWLAGRSSNGFHAALRSPEGRWSPRRFLSSDRWGGRGSGIAMIAGATGATVARGEPEGLVVDDLQDPPEAASSFPPSGHEDPWTPAPEAGTARAGVIFGDLHQHTMLSDGLGTPEEVLLAARHSLGHDFVAITDHDTLSRRALGPATWAALCETVEAAYEPGRFATLHAYELTGPRKPGLGHKCVIFPDADLPERLPEKERAAQESAWRRYGALAVPHHTGWTGTDAEHHDADRQPVWEVCSLHGVYEDEKRATAFPPRPDVVLEGEFVRTALDKGLRFGFVGGTDSHGLLWHHGISPRRDPRRTGLTGIPGAVATREAIFEALGERRCYATTGARIVLRVDLDGAPMGASLPGDARGELNVEVEGTASLTSVELVRRGSDERLRGTQGRRCVCSILVGLREGLSWDYLYVRVTQRDGEMAWSSPIFLG